MMFASVAITMIAFLLGYVLGRKHRRETEQEKLQNGRPTILVRPHTAKTIQDYPLPEERQDPSTVQEATWSRTNLPNSGVRWS